MLEQLSESRDVGIYSVAMQFADALMLLPSTIAMILFPRLVKTTDGSTFSHTVRTALWTATLLSVPVLILGLFAPQIILILFGAEFAPAAAALRALLPGVFAIGVATIFSQFISARGAPKSNVAIWLAASIIIVACNALLIPSFRSTGAGIALSICYGFAAAALIGLAFTMRKEPRTP
jgi:O-antigen/teichoic acid export membrane protein